MTIPATAPRRKMPEDPGSANPLSVLIIDDEPTLCESCSSVLSLEGYDVMTCRRGDEARDLVQRVAFDVLLIDLHMPQVNGMELLRLSRQLHPDSLVILMTGNPSVDSSIEAFRLGAWDYLPKPFTASHLQILIGRAWHTVMASRDRKRTGHRVESQDSHRQTPTLLGRSPAFLRALRLAEQVARTDASVFLTGESGSGKEVIAQFIHQQSPRGRQQMVAVNCAALPETLLESEMFGHVKGAFTGAVRDKPGLLQVADGGTFFLDELTEMALPIQAKLLRVIQDGQVRRLGSESVDARVDVRFIAATNQDPQVACGKGNLRMDLYYRLSVVPIRVPPLRERLEDIPLLAQHFLTTYWKRHRDRDAPIPTFTSTAVRELQSRPWIGNVRELQNVIEHAVVLLTPGSEIQADDIPHLDGTMTGGSSVLWHNGSSVPLTAADLEYHSARDKVLSEFELQYLTLLIAHAGSNMSEAARIAGIDRTTLYRLMEKHGVQRGRGATHLRDGHSFAREVAGVSPPPILP